MPEVVLAHDYLVQVGGASATPEGLATAIRRERDLEAAACPKPGHGFRRAAHLADSVG